MARKKTTQKQKQKQTVSQRQQVSQKVVVQVDTRRRRKATTKRRPKQAAAEQPMFVHPSLMAAPAPVPPAFFDPSAMETNRRLQLLGDDLEVLKAQEASRVNQAVRPTAITGEMATQTRMRLARPMETQTEQPFQRRDIPVSEISVQTDTSTQRQKGVSGDVDRFMSNLQNRLNRESLFLNPQPVNVPDRHVKADMATSPIQSPRYAVEEKGKQKEIVKNIRENQQAYFDKFAEIQNRVGRQMPFGITVPVEPPVFDLSGEPEVVVGEAPKRGRSRQPKQKPAEPFEPRRSARIAEMEAARQGLVNPIFGRLQSRVVIGQQPEEKIDL